MNTVYFNDPLVTSTITITVTVIVTISATVPIIGVSDIYASDALKVI